MLEFFFYGTLLDPEIRRLVLQRDVAPENVVPAILSDYRRYAVHDAPYPAAVRHPGAEIEGIVLSGLDAREAALLSHFEGHDYAATLCPVRLGSIRSAQDKSGDGRLEQAWVFIAGDRVPLTRAAWSLDAWRAAHKSRFLELARHWLGTRGDDEVAVHERIWRARLETG